MTRTVSRVAIVAAALAMIGGVLAGCGQAPEVSETSSPPVAPANPAEGSGTAERSPSPQPPGSTPREIRIQVLDGQVSGDTGRVEIPLDTPVTLYVTSDLADEIHLHGYDREAYIPAGGVGSISFLANIPGVFEVELHDSGLQLLQLQVS